MSTAARSHNVQLQSEATRESRDGDGGGEVEEWRQAEKGKEPVCLLRGRSIRGFGEAAKMREIYLKMYSWSFNTTGK